jgi:hypothetical protein
LYILFSMPKCLKCETILTGNLTLTNIEERSANLGVTGLFFNTSSLNSKVNFYCEAHFKEDILNLDFVKSAVAGSEFAKAYDEEKALNVSLTNENQNLKDKLDTKIAEFQTLKVQSAKCQSDLEEVRVNLEKTSKGNQTLLDQVNDYIVQIQGLKNRNDEKDKELHELKERENPRASQHASVKIGLKFGTYGKIVKLLEEWQSKLTDFNKETILAEIHGKIQVSFEEKVQSELDVLQRKTANTLEAELQETDKMYQAHEKQLKAFQKSFEEEGLSFSKLEKESLITPLQAKLDGLASRKVKLEEYVQELTKSSRIQRQPQQVVDQEVTSVSMGGLFD